MDQVDLLFNDDANLHGIVAQAFALAEDLPDEDQNNPNVVRNQNYFEQTIPQYTDFQFREHFRMSRATFQVLISILSI